MSSRIHWKAFGAFRIGIAIYTLGCAGTLHASCGLNFCPVPKQQDVSKSLSVSVLNKYTTFDIGGLSGGYDEIIPRVEYLVNGKYFFGASGSFVFLDDDSGSVAGLGNPLLYAEYRMSYGPRRHLYLGSQFELPLGDSENGLAGDHFMAMPYISGTQYLGASNFFSGTFGVLSVLSSDALGGHGASTQNVTVVNPHSNMEAHYRASLGSDWKALRLSPEAFFRGQYVLSEGEEETNYMSLGGNLLFHATPAIGLLANFEYHLTSPERFGWRSGLAGYWSM